MTKVTALAFFKSLLIDLKEQGFWPYGEGDKVALREAWNNYTDSLCKDGMITERQYETWTNPF